MKIKIGNRNIMKIITFGEDKDKSEWKAWRRNGIGGSDIAAVMHKSPYKTPFKLWNEKCGISEEETYVNKAMLHGIENETKALEWLNEDEGLSLKPIYIEDNNCSFFRASLDGYDSEKRVLAEIKCPVNSDILDDVKKTLYVPLLYWMYQIQWQIIICKPIRAILLIWDHRDDTYTKIESFAQPDLQIEMKEKAVEFWRMVQLGIPPEISKVDYRKINEVKLTAFLEEYDKYAEIVKDGSAKMKQIKEEVVPFGNGGNFISGRHTITRCEPRVGYDMEQMRKDRIDIDSYKTKTNGTSYYKITKQRTG